MKRFKDLTEKDAIFVSYEDMDSICGRICCIKCAIYSNGYKALTINNYKKKIYIPIHKMHANKCKVGKYWLFTSKKSFKKFMNNGIDNVIRK